MTNQLVLRHDTDGVTTLTLNRPDKLNALTPALFVELRGHIEALAVDERVGAVVLTGAGRSFCAGNDLESIAAGEKAPSRHYQAETIDALEQLPKPTIAKVRGHCFTGGLELALGCDLIVASEQAQFGDTHGQWGLVAVWGMTVRLPERVGVARAKELMYTARRISGADAAALGLANRAVAEDELDATVDALAAEITAASWDTSRIDKALLADHRTMTRAEALAHERAQPHGQPRDRVERMGRRGR
jgi:enoyl-CoA hydratase